jgi:hypothetical protein
MRRLRPAQVYLLILSHDVSNSVGCRDRSGSSTEAVTPFLAALLPLGFERLPDSNQLGPDCPHGIRLTFSGRSANRLGHLLDLGKGELLVQLVADRVRFFEAD